MSAICDRCGRLPVPAELQEFGGCGCLLLFDIPGLICPSPYSAEFMMVCPDCRLSVIEFEDERGYSWIMCACGMEDWEEQDAKMDRELDKRERQEGEHPEL
jgi:hypothetical protein